MEPKRELAFVGLFVVIAATLLVATVFAISGAFGRTAKTYQTYFAFGGGIEPGATVRYAGGPRGGRVEKLRIDPKNPERLEITLSVQSDLPVKQINNIAPQAQQLLHSLNDRATELKVTVGRVNDLLNSENRSNLSATLADTRGMIEENRPQVKSTLKHLNSASEKLEPLLQDLRKTSDQANQALNHIDAMVGENRADVRQVVMDLRKSLTTVTDITARLDQTLDVNSENIDELLENMRHVSENLKEFTDTIKRRPYTLIRATNPREHKPGEKQ